VRNLRHVVILVQTRVLVKCSVDCGIAVDCVITCVLVSGKKVVLPFYNSRGDFTVGTHILPKGSLACCLWVVLSS
jgi:hypothetical protein